LDGIKTGTETDLGSLLDGIKTGTETDLGSLLDGIKTGTETQGATGLESLIEDIKTKIMAEMSQIFETVNLPEEQLTTIMKMISTRFAEGADKHQIMEEVNRTIKEMVRQTLKETIETSKESIRELVKPNREHTLNTTEVKDYIDTIKDSFHMMTTISTNISTSLGDVKDLLRMISSLVLEKDEMAVFQTKTDNFTYHSTFLEGKHKRKFSAELALIELPSFVFKNQTLTVVEWTTNPYEMMSEKELYAPVVSIMLSEYETGSETEVKGLAEPINITLPMYDMGADVKPVCIYWDDVANDWGTDGCYVKGSDMNMGTIECSCSHLTDFSVGSGPSSTSNIVSGGSSSAFSKLNIGLGAGFGTFGVILITGLVAWKRMKKSEKKGEREAEVKPETGAKQENPIHSIV
jgi:hypothetical protein